MRGSVFSTLHFMKSKYRSSTSDENLASKLQYAGRAKHASDWEKTCYGKKSVSFRSLPLPCGESSVCVFQTAPGSCPPPMVESSPCPKHLVERGDHGKGFPGGSDGKESACNVGGVDSIPGSGRFPGEGNGNPLQYSCLKNPMDRGA